MAPVLATRHGASVRILMPSPRTWFAAIGGCCLHGCASQPEHHGPLPVRNQHPAQLTVLHMPPAATAVLPRGEVAARADLAYTSLFLGGAAAGNSFRMDGEYLRAATTLRLGLGSQTELSLELPVAHTSGGFLDSFVIGYHDWFGLPDQNRDEAPRGDYGIEARRGGEVVWGVEESDLELLDVPIGFAWNVQEARTGLGVTLRAAVELPTGDADRGYGNGELDYAAGLLLETQLGGVGCYGHLQHSLAGTPGATGRAGLDFADVTSMGFAAELPVLDSLQVLAQVEYETSTLRNLPVLETEREQFLLWIGARWRAGERWGLEVGFGEDLIGFVSPDFTAWIGFTSLPAAGGGGRSGP